MRNKTLITILSLLILLPSLTNAQSVPSRMKDDFLDASKRIEREAAERARQDALQQEQKLIADRMAEQQQREAARQAAEAERSRIAREEFNKRVHEEAIRAKRLEAELSQKARLDRLAIESKERIAREAEEKRKNIERTRQQEERNIARQNELRQQNKIKLETEQKRQAAAALEKVNQSRASVSLVKNSSNVLAQREQLTRGVDQLSPQNRDKVLGAAKDLEDKAAAAKAQALKNSSVSHTKINSANKEEIVQRVPEPGYHEELYANKPLNSKNATDKWDEFLGPAPYNNRHPRTGEIDPNRIVSNDRKRSIRYGAHEMNSKPTKHHYHEETWTHDPVNNVMNVDNTVIRVPLPKN
ncbi:hypothetical protein [Alkalimarinus coralli]|uniref:hypothetical protein n=1 Tax=Alkalimarinus coralli TaxID=2935863 RepID=UPI00202AF024|nr:hypothetical protein [Alkalimarinus coralli]